jgi:hypothetical protein
MICFGQAELCHNQRKSRWSMSHTKGQVVRESNLENDRTGWTAQSLLLLGEDAVWNLVPGR